MEVGDSVLQFAVYFVGGIACLGIFLRVYLFVTPYDDLKMIREGNASAAIVLAGALLGYTFPLAKSIEQTYAAMDFIIWAFVAMFVQIVVYFLVKKLFANFVEQVKADRYGEAIVLATISIAVGLLSAAAMTE